MIEKPKTKDKHFGIRLPEEMYKVLEAMSKEFGVSVGHVIRELVKQGLKRGRK